MFKSTRLTAPLLALLAVAPLACSSLGSGSKSLSDSVSSPFVSSSDSSKSSSQTYQEDVRDYTAGYVTGMGSTTTGLRNGLAAVASRHGVTNWEADTDTFVGIGTGLAKAGIKGAQYEGYRDALAAGDAMKAGAIDKGYKSGGND